MDLRHLRSFIVLAEELHFTRVAERLHIEQPPLSRAIKELEDELGVVLFNRDRRGTKLTAAGFAFLHDARRIFNILDQARDNVKLVAAGLRGNLRIAISDGALHLRLSTFLARCRAEEPEVIIRLSEVSLAEQLRGLRSGDFALGLAHTANVGEGIIAEPIWEDPLVIAVPARHALLAYKQIPLLELIDHPLILCDPQVCEGYLHQITQLLSPFDCHLNLIEHADSLEMMLTLVGAGYGVGFMPSTKAPACQRPDVVIRPLAAESATITTYLLRHETGGVKSCLERFLIRLRESDCGIHAFK